MVKTLFTSGKYLDRREQWFDQGVLMWFSGVFFFWLSKAVISWSISSSFLQDTNICLNHLEITDTPQSLNSRDLYLITYTFIKKNIKNLICWECDWNHIFPALVINLNTFRSSLNKDYWVGSGWKSSACRDRGSLPPRGSGCYYTSP